MERKVIDLSHYFPLFLWLSTYLPTYLSTYVSMYLCIYLSICLSVCLSIYLSICLSIYLSLSISLSLSVCLSVYLPDSKRSSSARLPHFSNLTTSRTDQFCDTSFIFQLNNVQNRSNSADLLNFELNNVKNKAILRDFLHKWKVECSAGSLVPMRFAIFPPHLCKVLRLPRKIDARSYDVPHLSRKIISANLKIWCSKMQPLSGNQRPDLLTSLMNMSFVLRLPREMHLSRSSSNVPRLPAFLEMLQNPHVLLTFAKVHNPLRLPRESTSERPKVLRTRQFFALLTSKCASRHNGVHFFDISTSNFQKWSDAGVFCTFWLGNVLRATTACNFSSLIWPAGSAPAALASLLFDPPEPQIIGKTTQCFATFLPFRASASSFFWLFLFYSSLF